MQKYSSVIMLVMQHFLIVMQTFGASWVEVLKNWHISKIIWHLYSKLNVPYMKITMSMGLRLLYARTLSICCMLKTQNCDCVAGCFRMELCIRIMISSSLLSTSICLDGRTLGNTLFEQDLIPSAKGGTRHSASAGIGSVHATKVQDSWRVLAKNARINLDIRLVSLSNELFLIKFNWFVSQGLFAKTKIL